jgi:hypothetical protein
MKVAFVISETKWNDYLIKYRIKLRLSIYFVSESVKFRRHEFDHIYGAGRAQ